ncbi:MAG: glycosyltransferase [Candidatus Omnitrophica bacterium]|nr:glycosyltransferase [Candidatus Omnitrophota bacterium]
MDFQKQSQPAVYYLAPDYAIPSWGVAMLYFHVEILRQAGIEAYVLHQTPGFRIEWVAHRAPVRYLRGRDWVMHEHDILVVPETLAANDDLLNLPGRKIVFVQNAFLMSGQTDAHAPNYALLGYENAMTILPHVRQAVENFCGLKAEIVPPFITGDAFASPDELSSDHRDKIILLYSKDKKRDFRLLYQAFEAAKIKGKNLKDWHFVELDGYSHAETMALMKKASFLVNLNTYEAFNTSVPEAMAAGCVVFCYDAYGGHDFLRPGTNAFVFKNHYIHELSDKLFDMLERFEESSSSCSKVRLQAYKTAGLYTRTQTQKALCDFFDALFRKQETRLSGQALQLPFHYHSGYKTLLPVFHYLSPLPEHRSVLLVGAPKSSAECAFLEDHGFDVVAVETLENFKCDKPFDVCIYLKSEADGKDVFEWSRFFLRKYGLLFVDAYAAGGQMAAGVSAESPHEALKPAALAGGFAYLEDIPMSSFLVYGLSGVIDIIVPAYNALDYIQPCISSIYVNTVHMPFRIIFVDDASPDPAVKEFFLSQKRPEDLYLRRETNGGFVKSSNTGFIQSESNDVVILNTDTIVSRCWLTHLFKAVMRVQAIGGANPLSNEASIYSIKRLSDYKKPNQAMQVGSWISRLDPVYPEIPTAVGFCLYFKRRLLNEIGFFDEIYGHGYGEENDLCMRAKSKAYRFVLADNAYVYHRGHVSMSRAGFLNEGQQTNPEHEAILIARYPQYPEFIQRFMGTNIMTHIRTRTVRCVQNHLLKQRKRILFALHNPIDGSHIGGTELHVKDLVDAFKQHAVCYVTYFLNQEIIIQEYTENIQTSYAFELPGFQNQGVPFSDHFVLEKYKLILNIFKIDLVHVHHLKNATFDIIAAAKQSGLPVIMTFHDFYMVSPDHGMMFKFKMEGAKEVRPDRFYFKRHFKIGHTTIESWCQTVRPFVRMIDEAIFPSRLTRDEILNYYPEIRSSRILEHGYPVFENPVRSDLRDAPADTEEAPAVCFLGAVHDARKGRKEISSIIRMLLRKKVHVHILGSNPSLWKAFLGSDYFHVHGLYLREELPARLSVINPVAVALLPSGIETHGYTLTEAWLAGYPAITWPIGAMAERIHQQGGGVVLDKICKREFIRCLLELIENPFKHEALKKSVEAVKVKTMAQSFEEYENLYHQLIPKPRSSDSTQTTEDFKTGMIKHDAGFLYTEMQKKSSQHLKQSLWQRIRQTFLTRLWFFRAQRGIG